MTATSSGPPTNVSPPVISGSPLQGQTLSASTGSWNGTQPLSYSYQWYRCDSGGNNCVASVTGATDLLGAADVGHTLRVLVSASNSAGSANSTSAATAAVTATSSGAPTNVSPPVITGSTQQGQTLSASTGSWNGTQPLSYSYQWYRCDSGGNNCVASVTGATDLLGSADVGTTIRVLVSASNSSGSANSTSAATAAVTATSSGAPTNVSPPVISGSTQQGQTLSASTGSWNGTQPLSYSYQWYRCDSGGNNCVASVTGATDLLGSADVGHTLRVLVSASNSSGSANSTSAATAAVTATSSGAPTNVSPPVISGSTQQGQTLTASTGSWNGTQPLSYSYQWYRCDSGGNNCAPSVTGSTDLLASADVGHTLRVLVSASNTAGSANSTSAATAAVTATSSGPPTIVSPPVISGSTQQGQTLSASTGSWNGTQPLSYSYQWYRCDSGGNNCAPSVTGSTDLLGSADVGSTLRVLVSASNTAGSANSTSAATAVVTGSQTQAPQCSRSSMSSCPASYFTGPLGNNNLIPAKPGAFLIDEYGGIGTSWAQAQAGLLQREQDMGRKFDGIGIHYGGSESWGGVFGMTDPTTFSPRAEQWIHDNGSFPLITWTPDYTITQINNGAADAIFAKAANYWKTYNFPIMLRIFDEFDNPSAVYAAVPDSANGNVNTCGAPFIAAWQRMVNIFKANGASNVGFWWTPEEGVTRTCVNASYPGDAYVDWVGSDWYNSCLVGNTSQWCTPLHSGWASFNEVFNYTALGSSLNDQHNLWGPHKPFVIGETGTWYDSNNPTYKGAWYANIPAAAQSMLYLRGIEFFDEDVSAAEGALNNFRVDYPTSDSSVYAGFKQMAANAWFNTG